MPQVADDERQQVAHDVRGHVAEGAAQRVGEQVLEAGLAAALGLDRGQVDRGPALPVQREGVLVRLDADHERVDGLVVGAEDALELAAEGERRGARGLQVVVEARAAAAAVPARVVVGDEDQHAAPLLDRAHHLVGDKLPEVGPADVEGAAEVAEGLDDAERRLGDVGQVDAPVHALEGEDRGRVLGLVAPALEVGLGAGEDARVLRAEFREPAHPLRDAPRVDRVRHASSRWCVRDWTRRFCRCRKPKSTSAG